MIPTSSTSSTPSFHHANNHRIHIHPSSTFDPSNPSIQQDILSLILDYLTSQNLPLSTHTLQDEANILFLHRLHHRDLYNSMSKHIQLGHWDILAKHTAKHMSIFSAQQGLLYALSKQEYLELIDRQEIQKAFSFLTTHLKPLEKVSKMHHPNEFHDLCYLLTCKSVKEAHCFQDYEGVYKSRLKLIEQLKETLQVDAFLRKQEIGKEISVPEHRLVTLLQQSVAYQMEFSRYHPKTVPKVDTLLEDFECEIIPNCVKRTYRGHEQNVKFVAFIGAEGELIASGSSDASVKVWRVESEDWNTGKNPCVLDLRGHASRIWYVTSNKAGSRLYSGSGDGTIKIWNLQAAYEEFIGNDVRAECLSTLHCKPARSESYPTRAGDVYSVALHPHEAYLASAGYDQTVRLFDIETSSQVKTFCGHTASVCDAQFNRHANLILSGSKDGSIRFWDISSGICVHTLRQTLGEVTSIALASDGFGLLSGSRNNSNRLWDLRMLHAPRTQLQTSRVNADTGQTRYKYAEPKPLQRFKGHQNTAKNIVRVSFGPKEAFVLGGSEDGAVCVWDVSTGTLLEKLTGHEGVVYNAQWHEKQALMVSSSHDCTVKTWWWQEET